MASTHDTMAKYCLLCNAKTSTKRLVNKHETLDISTLDIDELIYVINFGIESI